MTTSNATKAQEGLAKVAEVLDVVRGEELSPEDFGMVSQALTREIARAQAGKYAASTLAKVGPVPAKAASVLGLKPAILMADYTRMWGSVFEEGTAQILDVAFAGATAHPLSLLAERIRF